MYTDSCDLLISIHQQVWIEGYIKKYEDIQFNKEY